MTRDILLKLKPESSMLLDFKYHRHHSASIRPSRRDRQLISSLIESLADPDALFAPRHSYAAADREQLTDLFLAGVQNVQELRNNSSLNEEDTQKLLRLLSAVYLTVMAPGILSDLLRTASETDPPEFLRSFVNALSQTLPHGATK